MWQPNRTQWSIIWSIAILLILAWPPAEGRSLMMKVVNWAVDPAGALPGIPAALPMGLDDNGDAVAAHDAELTAYYQRHDSGTLTRWRMDMKTADDPLIRSPSGSCWWDWRWSECCWCGDSIRTIESSVPTP